MKCSCVNKHGRPAPLPDRGTCINCGGELKGTVR